MTDRAAVRLAIAGLALLTLLRVAVAFLRTGPLVVADELGYLTDARVLTGGPAGDIGSGDVYRGGYALLIAPVVGPISDPTTAYRAVLIVNAVLGIVLAGLIFLLLRRTFGVATGPAALGALAGAAFPSISLQSELAMSENLLMPLTVGWVLCLGELARAGSLRRQTAWAVAAAVVASLLIATHGRMLVAVALTVVALAWLAARRRIHPFVAMAGVVAVAVGYLLAGRLTEYVIDHNYGGNHPDEVGGRLDAVDGFGGVLSVARNMVGQTWYLLVASLGIVLLVAVMERRRLPARLVTPSPAGIALAALVATGAGLLVLSSISFADPSRPDMLVYGRYVEVVIPPLIALAAVRLALHPGRRDAVRASVAGLLVLTAAVAALRAPLDLPGRASRFNVAALTGITRDLQPAALVLAGVVAAAALVAVALVSRRRPWLVAPLVAVLFLPTTAYVLRDPLWTTERQVFRDGWTDPGPAAAGVPLIGYDTDHADGAGQFVTQWFLPDARYVSFSGASQPPPARYVISSGAWNEEHPDRPGTVVWSYGGRRDQHLWRLGG